MHVLRYIWKAIKITNAIKYPVPLFCLYTNYYADWNAYFTCGILNGNNILEVGDVFPHSHW